MFKGLFSTFFSILFLFYAAGSYAVSSEVSKIRTRKILDVIRRYTNAKEKLSDPYVKEAIFDDVGKILTLEPEEKPNIKTVKEIAKEVREKVVQRFPDSINIIKKKAVKEANKKYKMANKLDQVTLTVIKGRKSYTVSGIFYGFGLGEQSVRIGDNPPIAFFDLAPMSRILFDKPFCEIQKRNFIDDKVRSYYQKKGNYSNKLFAKMRASITADNEALGYIYAWNKWRTPKSVTGFLIEKIQTQQEKNPVIVKNDNKDPDKNTNPDDGVKPVPGDGNSPEVDPSIESEKLRLAKLTKSVEDKQLEIAGSQYGIDADQGYLKDDKRILWGMNRADVNLIFKGFLNTSGDNNTNVATIEYEQGAIKQVRLYFLNDIFYKVDIVYNIGPKEGMMLIWQKLNDKYGESIEGKALREADIARLARIASIKHPCKPNPKTHKETHKWDKKGICKKCKISKNDIHPPPPPLNQSYTWKGDITTGILNVMLSRDRNNFTNLTFTKENPQIRKEEEDKIEAERKRKIEEDKQKKLDEYRKLD